MTAPRRLLQEGADGFERRLLRAAHGDGPTRKARAGLLASLGVAAAATTAEGAVASGAGATAAKVLALKSLGVAVLVTTIGASAVHVARSGRPSPMSAHELVTTVPDVPRPAAPPGAVIHKAPALEPPVASIPAAPPEPRVDPAVCHVALPLAALPLDPAALPSALTAETASLDAARTALHSGRAAEALSALDAYARVFPRGALGPEASALRVEALLAAGDRSGAEAVARGLFDAQPRSSAARRARAMLNW